MMHSLRRRLVSAVCAAAMLFSSAGSAAFPITAADQDHYGAAAKADPDGGTLCRQSLAVHPDGGDPEQIITLDGLMPDGAEAEAVDVSDAYDGIAAYDITILDGSRTYQPGEANPILVEITDPVIPESGELELWHIRDDGVREQIPEFSAEDGKITFYAAAFSVYEIVALSGQFPGGDPVPVTSVDDLTSEQAANGFYLYYNTKIFFTSQLNENGCLTESTDPSDAALWYFEPDGDFFRIYTMTGGQKRYICRDSGNSITLSDRYDRFAVTAGGKSETFYLKKSDANLWLQHSGSGGGIRYYTDNKNADNSRILMYFNNAASLPDDAYELDGKTYGLMNFTGGTHGYAMMGDSSVHALVELVTHQTSADDKGLTLYVDEGSEVTRWTFHSAGNSRYTLSAETQNGTQYLAVNDGSLVLADTPDAAAEFTAAVNSKGKIRLTFDGKYITFTAADSGGDTVTGFTLSSETGERTWLNLLGFAALTDEDLITYSAERISVSEAVDGQRVIVYTRLWNETTKQYDMYAVDHDGTLYPCYASGGKILWLGDGTGSLEWEFTEHLDAVTKQPNYYYELYNPYSEKYIAPQIAGDQILSDSTIGINLPGRRNGEFYSDILAWDGTHYAYIGMKPDAEKSRLVPCAQSVSVPFYFAALEELNLNGRLHEVGTIDNAAHGITMKMFNFGYADGISKPGLADTTVTRDYFGGDYSNKQGLLETSLTCTDDDDGYPAVKSTGRSFRDMYASAEEVNHLFIESVYNSSGYFEFDSCQNFATLNGKTGGDFTVYRELGTTNAPTKTTLQHGQFFPYNTIEAGRYSTSSPQNLYSMEALASGSASAGILDENDPRKYEKLHLIKDPDYFFGMEMSAGFVQTVSGLDAWGHDIIFDFTGDDDFWLYVDGELVIDLGGTHSAERGRVNFRTGEVIYSLVNEKNSARIETTTTLRDIFRKNYEERGITDIDSRLDEIFEDNGSGQYIFKDYTTHTMRVFYMERGAGASNLHMRFNLASVTPGHVVVSKSLSGAGAEVLDKDFVEYPFQIYYTLPEGENNEPGEEHLLTNDDEHIRVTYQNSNQPVTFVRKYRPPGFAEEDAYESIYFLNPSKNAEISFPDETISYRIVECAVDSTVYGNVKINGAAVPTDRIEIRGDLRSYKSDLVTAENRPTITFDNCVNDNVIKDLFITKKLLDENDQEITDDPATFSFRLYLSSVDISADALPLANMYRYYVLSPDKLLCRFDPETQRFAEVGLPYSREQIQAVADGAAAGITTDDITFCTSGFGAISGIPAGYTVVVPNLPVGTVFKVTEDVRSGYGLVGYERVMGTKVNADHSTEDIPSYHAYGGNPLNVGKIIAEENPQMEVRNKKGYGLTVNKKWSDLALTTSHDPVYVAVYADGSLLEGSVRQIASPSTSAYYFWTALIPNADGSTRTDLDGYEVREVTLSGTPAVAADGTVTGYGTVTPLDSGEKTRIHAVRTAAATPAGEDCGRDYDYVVSYETGTAQGTTRTDTITNTREGGIAVRLFRWGSRDPLAGGTFRLTDSSGKTVGTYTSDADGIVTMLYSFESGQLYTLTQTAAPRGYVGLQRTLRFRVNADETISLFEADGTSAWDDPAWAIHSPGSSGITGFVDVFNKPFRFKIIKTDSEDASLRLSSAHFALYKQANTTISGYVKNKAPLTGFEDLVTVGGEVDICGGDSGRMLTPGEKGAVYFLTETQAPFNYERLAEDIVFRLSPLGVPSLISDAYDGQLIENEDCYVYTLSVPNTAADSDLLLLTIEKQVGGAFGDRSKDFTFTVKVSGAGDGSGFAWAKNGAEQPAMSRTGGSFTMKHDDRIELALPAGTNVKITEKSEGYETVFTLGSDAPVSGSSIAFTFTDSSRLLVTNTLNGTVAAGLASSWDKALLLTILPVIPIGMLLYRRRKRENES